MQSSAMNCLSVRLKTSIHSPQESFSGLAGARPRGVSVAVDKGERAEACFLPALPTAAHQQPHGSADPARYDEADAQRGRRGDGQFALELLVDVHPRAQVVDGVGEAVALRLDVAANLLGGAAVTFGHCPSTPHS